jgi:hypothetical protein
MVKQTDFLKVKKKVKQKVKQKDWLTLKETGKEMLKDFQKVKLTQRDSVMEMLMAIRKGLRSDLLMD